MDGSRIYFAKWNKSQKGRQILYNLSYVKSKKQKKQNKNELIGKENKRVVGKGWDMINR